jgi:hypothetical protein
MRVQTPRRARVALCLLGGWVAACELHALGLGWIPTGPVKWLHVGVMGAGAALCVLCTRTRVDT